VQECKPMVYYLLVSDPLERYGCVSSKDTNYRGHSIDGILVTQLGRVFISAKKKKNAKPTFCSAYTFPIIIVFTLLEQHTIIHAYTFFHNRFLFSLMDHDDVPYHF
jgi:hypothetical protein